MFSLIMLLQAGVAWPVSNSERRGGLLLLTSGIQSEAVFASGPTPVTVLTRCSPWWLRDAATGSIFSSIAALIYYLCNNSQRVQIVRHIAEFPDHLRIAEFSWRLWS
jgi:hypothetical protein